MVCKPWIACFSQECHELCIQRHPIKKHLCSPSCSHSCMHLPLLLLILLAGVLLSLSSVWSAWDVLVPILLLLVLQICMVFMILQFVLFSSPILLYLYILVEQLHNTFIYVICSEVVQRGHIRITYS